MSKTKKPPKAAGEIPRAVNDNPEVIRQLPPIKRPPVPGDLVITDGPSLCQVITVDGAAVIVAPLMECKNAVRHDPAQRFGTQVSDCSIVPRPPLPLPVVQQTKLPVPHFDRTDIRFWGSEFYSLLAAMRGHLPHKHTVRRYFEATNDQYGEGEISETEQPGKNCVEMAHQKLTPAEWAKVWNGWTKSKDVPTADDVFAQMRDERAGDVGERVELTYWSFDDIYVSRHFDASEDCVKPIKLSIAVGTRKEEVIRELKEITHAIDNEWDDLITTKEGSTAAARKKRGAA